MSNILTLTIEVDLGEVSPTQKDVAHNIVKLLHSREKMKLSSIFDLSSIEGYITELSTSLYPNTDGPALQYNSHMEVKINAVK